MSVRVETNVGSFVVDLFVEDAPKAALNFLKLCKINYYAFSIFLRCEANFLLQGGDPTNTGKGGESIWQLLNSDDKDRSLRFFGDEISGKRNHSMRGTLSMAAAGKDKNASQFFLTLADNLDFLDGTCTIFGQLTSFTRNSNTSNTNNVDTEEFFEYFNNELYCDEAGRPFQDVYIMKTVVLSDPFPDLEGMERLLQRDRSGPSESFLKHKRIGAHESLDESKGKTAEEVEEELRERAAKSNALVLEIIGDLPSADVKPPENVLFVCKLNPLTQSTDLRMIFSRFGPIVSCEVIKDRDTSSSLGYAFIEFEEKESCEQAYLKMDNVLVDDKRIKVDFSQSVSKLHRQWEAKRRDTREQGKMDHRRDRIDSRDRREHKDYRSRDRDSRDYHSESRDRTYRDTRYRSRSPGRR